MVLLTKMEDVKKLTTGTHEIRIENANVIVETRNSVRETCIIVGKRKSIQIHVHYDWVFLPMVKDLINEMINSYEYTGRYNIIDVYDGNTINYISNSVD